MMRLLRLHLASDEFDAADFYARKIKADARSGDGGRGHGAARVGRAPPRRCARASAGAWPPSSSSESRARASTALDARQDQGAGGAGAQAHRAQRDRRQHRRQGRARAPSSRRSPLAEVTLPSVLEAYYERADALYRELDDSDGAGRRGRARSPSTRRSTPDVRLRFARAAVRAMVRGLPVRRGRRGARASVDAPADRELAFAVELGRAVNAHSRRGAAAAPCATALVALYKKQKRLDRQRAVVLDAVQRASRLEAEKLVEALAQLYVDDVPRGTQRAPPRRAAVRARDAVARLPPPGQGPHRRTRATPSGWSPTPPIRSRRTSATSICGCAKGATPRRASRRVRKSAPASRRDRQRVRATRT